MDFNFYMPVKVIGGKDAVLKNSAVLTSLGSKALIVTGGSSAVKSGALSDFLEAANGENIECTVFNKIGQNPLIETCFEAGALAREIGAEFIVGIGGGSPMDAAKAVSVYAANESISCPEDIYSLSSFKNHLPLVLVGTTSGTGSEVSGVSVLSSGKTGRKKSISGIHSTVSFACPEYTSSMPLSVTVSTALDAFSHGVEGWFSPNLSDAVRVFGEKGIPMVWSVLKAVYENAALPNEEQRETAYYGSLFTGMVLNACGTAFPHPMGYVLTEDYGVPHGMACAAFLPAFIERAVRYEPQKAQRLFELTGETLSSMTDVIKSLTKTENVSMTYEQAQEYSKRWVGQKNFKIVPGGYTEQDALSLLRELFCR